MAIKVVIDTNLWISFLISNRLSQLDDLLKSNQVKIAYSNELLNEFVEVARRPKFQKFFTELEIILALRILEVHGTLVDVKSDIKVCRDPKDNFLMNLAVDANARFLITGDDDLLVIEQIENTKILQWAAFLEEIDMI
ncbi:MAG: putative toxin-antitoxin system toxin component, PIN family [Bacteroidia bacterium]